MKQNTKWIHASNCLLMIAVSAALFSPVHAGSLTPSQSPAPTMYTLTDIYNRISSGTAAGTHTMSPSAAPGPTMYTLDALYNALPGGTTTSATAVDVKNGKTVILRAADGPPTLTTGTGRGSWGHQLPATGSTTTYTNYDDAYNESHSVGFSSAARTMSYTMYNYTGGSLVQTTDVNVASVTVDNVTGLVWMTDGNKGGAMSETAAITWCQNLNSGGGYAGFTDWRLPNIRELQSIINIQNYMPSIDTANFRNTQSAYYWSSTAEADLTSRAWMLLFKDGFRSNNARTSPYYVRPVRGGP
jgi:hypothetical protein